MPPEFGFKTLVLLLKLLILLLKLGKPAENLFFGRFRRSHEQVRRDDLQETLGNTLARLLYRSTALVVGLL